MRYLSRTARRRSDVRQVVPAARSVISLGNPVQHRPPLFDRVNDPDAALISRYAWGQDYHDVVGGRTEDLLERMRAATDEPFAARSYVDTGPVQERVYAQHAGLGWIGKNTCLINPEKGSWFFLSEIITSLALEPDPPQLDQCGTCTLCIEACPTDAIREPWVLDATRCLSYLTIELRGAIPEGQRPDVGTRVYGCDICQDVCPYNAAAARSDDPAWKPTSDLDQPRLSDLWRRSDESLAALLERSAMSRAKLTGLRRNVAVALGNSTTVASAAAIAEPEPKRNRRAASRWWRSTSTGRDSVSLLARRSRRRNGRPRDRLIVARAPWTEPRRHAPRAAGVFATHGSRPATRPRGSMRE